MSFTYLSVCSGIEAASHAWHPLGWRPWAFSQFDPDHKGKGPDFASAVLKLHYPDVPNLGDMTKYREWPDATLDVLVGGTPCQSFSVAGLRGGLDDERGNLMLVYCAIARKYRPRWVVWENVPGVLSDDGGRSFAGLLGLLSGSRVEVPAGGWRSAGVVSGYSGAYGLAWRVLDSQFVRVDGFGRAVPQRRRRVFVVGYIGGDWRRAAAVLFERSSMSGDSPPRRGSRESVAGSVVASAARRGGVSEGERGGLIPEASGTVTAHAARARGTAGADQAALIPEVSPPLMASVNTTGGNRFPGTDGDTVHSLIPEVSNPLTAPMAKGVNMTMGEGQTMIGDPFAFKASHFTRGKDGAPSPVHPPLSADADKGDQDPLICEPIPFDPRQIHHPANHSSPKPGDVSHPLRAVANSQPAIAYEPIPFDETQITNPNNRSPAVAGAPSHPLASTARPPAIAFNGRQDADAWEERTGPLDTDGGTQSVAQPVSFDWQAGGGGGDASFRGKSRAYIVDRPGATRSLTSTKTLAVATQWVVRRLTPEECERLQGFPDGYTNIPWRGKNGSPDGPRYKALGNSMSCNVMRWIGRRVQMVDEICKINIDIHPPRPKIAT